MIPRRMLGFGFALFLMLVILAVIYSQYAMRNQPNSGDGMAQPKPAMGTGKSTATAPLPGSVNPSTVADDLIDEALTDRDDLPSFVEDELADIEEGN